MGERIKINAKRPLSTKENSASNKQKTGFKSQNSHVDRILFLQRTIGNQAVQRLIKSGALQAKLRIGQPGDKYEQEADRVADEVMRMPEPGVQRQVEPEEEEEEILQTKPVDQITPLVQRQVEEEEEEEEEMLQAKSREDATSEVSNDLESQINAIKGGGRPLAESERAYFEPRFGTDFSNVRIHSDKQASNAARSVNARAFTFGHNVVFGAGEYSPDALAGRKLLAHELTHVVQQSMGSQGHIQRLVEATRVSCQGYPRTYQIFTSIRTNDPLAVIQSADRRALEMLNNTISELTRVRESIINGAPAAAPLIDDTVARGMRNRLRLNADDRAVWTGRGRGTVELIIRWFTNIRDLLASGRIRYTCLGTLCAANWWAYTVGGRTIHLCRLFWRGSNDNRALTLAHETAHLYYGLEDTGGGAGNAVCLEQFLADANGVGILPEYIGVCRPPAP